MKSHDILCSLSLKDPCVLLSISCNTLPQSLSDGVSSMPKQGFGISVRSLRSSLGTSSQKREAAGIDGTGTDL